MKSATSIVAGIVFVLSALAPLLSETPALSVPAADKNAQPVIVELFTSEGCSSCPPADALLMTLESGQPVKGANIIALEEHVDYWNHEGWRDVYSSADWTQRQVDYVSRFKEESPYTPQMVVDGQTQLLGSRQFEAERAIQQAAVRPKTGITVTPENNAPDGTAQFKVRVAKLLGNADRDTAEVWLAVTESGLQSAVSAGENAGKDLRHASVVRSMHRIGVASPSSEIAFEASPQVKLKTGWNRRNVQVVVFIQEKKSLRILGAASSGFAA